MPKSDPTPFHVGLTPERVIDAAVELTTESHLMVWSIRDLAKRLGVTPSVIYHHVGGKDLLCRRVVERMVAEITLPDAGLGWQEWFSALLNTIGPIAAKYPGTAKWMFMHGPTLPAALPTLEAGLTVLHRSGFGSNADLVYATLFNNAILTVAANDDRRQHEEDGPRDHATMMAEFAKLSPSTELLQSMGQDLMRPFAAGGQVADQRRWEYYRFVVDTTIAGLEAMLGPTDSAS